MVDTSQLPSTCYTAVTCSSLVSATDIPTSDKHKARVRSRALLFGGQWPFNEYKISLINRIELGKVNEFVLSNFGHSSKQLPQCSLAQHDSCAHVVVRHVPTFHRVSQIVRLILVETRQEIS